MFTEICRNIVKFFLFFVFRIVDIGKENVISEGGAIFAVNHRSNWDVIVIGSHSPRKLTFIAKEELFKNPIGGFIIRKLGAFPVKRGKGDIGAVKAALSILSQKKVMLIFPEGTRNRTGEPVKKVKEGMALFATRAKVPVIPVYIDGEYKWFSKITITYGKPMYFDEYYGKKVSQEELSEISNNIYKTMWSLKDGNK